MNIAKQIREPRADYLTLEEPALLRGFELLATAEGGVAKLRELILALALQGKLVPQSTKDEPASAMLAKIRKEKAAIAATGRRKANASAPTNHGADSINVPAGWCVSSLAEIGIISPRNTTDDDTLTSFVQMSSIPVGLMATHTTEQRRWGEIKSGFTHFAEGDVGLAKITPCFENGKSTIFRNLENGVGAGTTELHIVRPLGNILPEYILVFLKSPAFLKNGEAGMTGSAGQKRLPRAYFESTAFPLPPLPEQHRIVARVKELMALCDELEARGRLADEQHARLTTTLFDALTASDSAQILADNWQRIATHFDLLLDRPQAIDALEQTILQLAVRGLLVPQDARDEPASELLSRMRHERAAWLQSQSAVDSESRSMIKKLVELPASDTPFSIPETWQFAHLIDCSRLLVDCHNKTAPYANSGVPLIRTTNVRNGQFRFEDPRFVSKETYEYWSRRCPPMPGDIIFTREAPMGEAAIIPEGAKYCLGQRTMLVRPMSEYIDSNYLLLALTEPHLLERAMPSAIGSTVKHLRVGDVERLTIPVPPLAEQHRIVARVEHLRHLCADLHERLNKVRATQTHLAETLVTEATQSQGAIRLG